MRPSLKTSLLVALAIGVLVPFLVPSEVIAAATGITANQIQTGAPSDLVLTNSSNTEGTSLGMARKDHGHAVSGTLSISHGGTGVGALAQGAAYSNGSTLATTPGTSTTVLHGNAFGNPSFGAVVDGDISGTVTVPHGGTGLATLTNHALQVGAGTSSPTQLGLGTTTTVLHGNASGDPSFGAVALTTDVSGVLPVANGGTGAATSAAYTVFGNPTSSSAAPQFTTDPVVSSLTATVDSGITGPIGLSLGVAGTATGAIRFYESTNATHFTNLAAQDPGASKNLTFQLPPDYPATAGMCMQSTAAGLLSFATLAANVGGSGVASPTAHGVLLGEGASAFTSLTSTADALHILQSQSGADPVWTNNPTVSTLVAQNTSPSLIVGLASSATGGIAFKGASSTNTTTLTVPATPGAVTVMLPTVATTFPTANPGTSGMCLQATTLGVQSYAALNLGTAALVTGSLGAANGGTGLDTSAATGVPSISSGTWSTAAQLTVAKGGTGAASFGSAVGAIPVSGTSGTGAMGRVDAVAAGQILISAGTGTAPVWSGSVYTCTSSASTTCTITVARSGCTQVCGPGGTAAGTNGLKSSAVSGTTLTCTFLVSGTNTCACICP